MLILLTRAARARIITANRLIDLDRRSLTLIALAGCGCGCHKDAMGNDAELNAGFGKKIDHCAKKCQLADDFVGAGHEQ